MKGRRRREATWRIDDLAQQAGVSVDTIRYYAREGLLPRPQRSGRHKLYGPQHLDRLARIRDLQEQRFSLAAIKAIIDADMPGVEEIFSSGDRHYTLEELAESSGLDDAVVGALRSIGILPDPSEFGREAYDTADLRLLEAAAELLDLGMPEEFLVELGRVYVVHFQRLQADVMALLRGEGAIPASAEELGDLQRRLTGEAGRLVPAAERVIHYVHQRTLQRLTLEGMRAARTEPGGAPSFGRPSLGTPSPD